MVAKNKRTSLLQLEKFYNFVHRYSCRKGMFVYSNGTTVAYITLTCINAVGGGAPYWDPPYDNDINPFPTCQVLGEWLLLVRILRSGERYGKGAVIFSKEHFKNRAFDCIEKIWQTRLCSLPSWFSTCSMGGPDIERKRQ